MSSINDEVYVLLWALFVVNALVPDEEETYKQSLMILSEEGGEIYKIIPTGDVWTHGIDYRLQSATVWLKKAFSMMQMRWVSDRIR